MTHRHRGAAAFFFRQRIGVAADDATRAECHVNGHGTTTRPHPLTRHSRHSRVPAAKKRRRGWHRDKNCVPRQWTWHYYPPPGTTTRRHFPFLRILPLCVLRRRFAFRRVLLYLSSKTIYENDWERHPKRVLISLPFPIWHTAIVSVIHYHGVHMLSMLLSSTSLVSLCRCPTPYRVSANLQAGLSCTTKIITLHGKVYRMANWP